MAEIDVIIDDLGNSIVHEPTGEVFATRMVPWKDLAPPQRAALTGWQFDWRKEANAVPRDVVALFAKKTDAIQGLMSFEARKGYVFIHLLENAPHNFGRNKLFRGVAPNLVAYACTRSVALGFDGFVGFDAKTELIEHYKVSLGAQQAGSSHRMFIDAETARDLVKRYFNKESDQWP